MKTLEQQIRDCSYEIIVGMEDNVPKEELFKTLVKKYSDEVLYKALETVDKFQHWRAKKHGIDLGDLDKQFEEENRNRDIRNQDMKCFEPEMYFFGGSIVHEKEDKKKGKYNYGK